MDTLIQTEKVFLFMSRLLSGNNVDKKPVFVSYPQRVRWSDTGVAAVVVTMDRHSAFPSDEGFLRWHDNEPESHAQSLWLRKKLASRLFQKSPRDHHDSYAATESTLLQGTYAEELGAEGGPAPRCSSSPLLPSPLPSTSSRSPEVNPQAEQASPSPLSWPSSRSPDVGSETEQAQPSRLPLPSPDVEPETEQDVKASPEPTGRSLRRRTAPKVAYNTSVHPQDEELKRSGVPSDRRGRLRSNRRGGQRESLSRSAVIRLIKSCENSKRLQAARLLNSTMTESSRRTRGDPLPWWKG